MNDTYTNLFTDVEEFWSALHARVMAASGPKSAEIYASNVDFKPGTEHAKLRAKLIAEEASEVVNALHSENAEDALKELTDLMYVTVGALVAYKWDAASAWDRVQDNNMKKVEKGTIDRDTGKLIKPRRHPKVSLRDLVGEG